MGTQAFLNKAASNDDCLSDNFGNSVFYIGIQLKLGWINSIIPPDTLAQIKTLNVPKRPVLEREKDRAGKTIIWTILSLPFGFGVGASKDQSITAVSVGITKRVR